ncbi:MAG: prephenate dehydratase [Rhodocyclaceae bacterium]
MSDEQARLRAEIAKLDADILDRLAARGALSQRASTLGQGPLYGPEHEAQALRAVLADNAGPLPDEAVQRIFREIMAAGIALERPQAVAYLGPQGTYSEAAVLKHFGSAPQAMPQHSIDEVFRAVETGAAHFGIVPVENSTEGAVGRTLDLLLASTVQVSGEVGLRVRHNLMSTATELSQVRRVYSHAQSLGQCTEWLNQHMPQAERLSASSNAEAARMAVNDSEAAAIAGEVAAVRYGLTILAANIEDEANNTTRFLVIGRQDAGPSGRDKTSIVCSTSNRAGSVFHLLRALADEGVSMSKFESRPSRAGLWEYVFYIDVEGHRSEPAVVRALDAMRASAGFLKVLGSYPVAVI